MQRAEESMAKDKGVPVIKFHLDKETVYDMRPYLKALLEAMKTMPKSEERTITYYPEAVELKGTLEGIWPNKVFVRE